MARLHLPAVTEWITAAALQHPNDLPAELALRTGVTRATANRALRRLVETNWLVKEGSASRARYRPGLLRQVVKRYPLDGLAEDITWSRDFAPCFQLPLAVRRMTQHAFSELVNNAIDHSGGTSVTVSIRQTPSQVQLLVSDDGRGLFDCIGDWFGLTVPALAMLELSKGKLTSQPDRHSGRGLFFTSKLADVFDIHANDAAYQRREWEGPDFVPGRPLRRGGTSIFAAIALDTARTLESVLAAFSIDGEGLGFDRTVVPLNLLAEDGVGLESRAQAKRIASRLDRFERAEIDFRGIAQVGHGFADELFRVQPAVASGLRLVPINMSPAVAAMVASVRGANA
jgi:anti-sigma regulatory factor (Ser/Thr protein kinase)